MIDRSEPYLRDTPVTNEAMLSCDTIRQDFQPPGGRSMMPVIDGISFEVGRGIVVMRRASSRSRDESAARLSPGCDAGRP